MDREFEKRMQKKLNDFKKPCNAAKIALKYDLKNVSCKNYILISR